MSPDPAPFWPRVVVIGPGAVGAFYGGMLARAGAPVTMLGRPGPPGAHLEAMARDGVRLRSIEFDEYIPVETSTHTEIVASADLVLFCVKSTDTDEATRQIAEHVGPDAIVVDLQNGVDNPERMRRAGVDPIAAVVYVAAAIEAPGEITHRGRGDLVIGHASRRGDVERVAEWFERAGVKCPVSEDVERALWKKLILNSMANAVSALTGAGYGTLVASESAWRIAIDVAHEAVAVARTAGHDFNVDDVVRLGYEVCSNVGAATSSTQQDIARGRRTEIDSLNGYVARCGEAAGIPTPVNRTLWALVKLRETLPGDRA